MKFLIQQNNEGTWTAVVSEVKQTRISNSTKEMQVTVIIKICDILGKTSACY